MSEFWKKTAFRGSVGFILGVMVGVAILSFSGVGEYCAQNGTARFVLYLMSSGVLGAINMGTTTLYSLERWGLLRCTLTHFCVVMATLCAVGFSMGWLSLRDPATRWILGISVVAYFAVWAVMYWDYKRKIRRINEALKDWRASQKDG